MKVAIAQIKTNPSAFEENYQKILGFSRYAAELGEDMVVFPECTISGYASMDLFLNDDYIQENLNYYYKLIDTLPKNILVIFGFVDLSGSASLGGIDLRETLRPDGHPRRYNCAAAVYNNEIVNIVDKTLIPTYDVFDESRYFERGRKASRCYHQMEVIGMEICEDMWSKGYTENPSERLATAGATLLVNISASPYYMGKNEIREKLITDISTKYNIPFIYCNSVGGQDGYDGELVFEGRSMVFNKDGKLLAMGKAFEEDFFVVDIDKGLPIEEPEIEPIGDLRNSLVSGIRDYCSRNGFKKAVIGLSGGIDSAVVAALTTEALGCENVTGVTMPSEYSSSGSVEDSLELAKNLDIEVFTIPIANTVEVYKRGLNATVKDNKVHEFLGCIEGTLTEENLQARIRGTILMSYSNNKGALLVTTGNKTELALGYCTIGGDMMGGLAPISDVYKMDVYALARNYNLQKIVVPLNTIEKAPSAELSPNQTDEKGLGAGYNVLDPLVNEIIDGNLNAEDLSSRYPQQVVEKCLNLFRKSEFKRRQYCSGIKVCKKSFGIGRRIPMVHSFSK